MCGDPVPEGRLYFDSSSCAARYDRLSRAERACLRAGAVTDADAPPPSAAEIRPDMPAEAVRWRTARRERLGRPSATPAAA